MKQEFLSICSTTNAVVQYLQLHTIPAYIRNEMNTKYSIRHGHTHCTEVICKVNASDGYYCILLCRIRQNRNRNCRIMSMYLSLSVSHCATVETSLLYTHDDTATHRTHPYLRLLYSVCVVWRNHSNELQIHPAMFFGLTCKVLCWF